MSRKLVVSTGKLSFPPQNMTMGVYHKLEKVTDPFKKPLRVIQASDDYEVYVVQGEADVLRATYATQAGYFVVPVEVLDGDDCDLILEEEEVD